MGLAVKTTALALIAGAMLGALVMLLAGNFELDDGGTQDVARDLVAVPAMTQAIADKHRDERYRNVTSIEGVMALPSEFMRSEAMYALAGRSSSGRIQALVFEADRVADDIEREQILGVLFFRLAEIDPQSALTLARTDRFRIMKALERTVWRAWARNDLDEALFAARAQTSMVDQKVAAQSLYAAFGYMGNATTEKIEAEMGIEPDQSTRDKYLYRLADESPAEAIAYINGVTDNTKKWQYISKLADYLSLTDSEQALRYATLFAQHAAARYFERIVKRNIAADNPVATIERLLASGANLHLNEEFSSAVRALAKSDTRAAMRFYQQIRPVDARRNVGYDIGAVLARRDPDGALAWAQENDRGQHPSLQMGVLGTVASEDPQRAMDMALALPNSEMKAQLLSHVVQTIAGIDSAAEAVAYLDQINQAEPRLEASQRLLQNWIRYDAGAAMEWALGLDDESKANLIPMTQHVLVESDIEAAVRFLPRLQEFGGDNLRNYIAERLASTRSPEEALSFVRQFEGEQGYGELQSTVVSVVAQTDVYSARQLADQLPAGAARDRAYVGIIAEHARANPVEATRWLNNIDEARHRGSAAGQIASAWSAIDSAAANQWVATLPSGVMRDYTIMQLASQWRGFEPRQQAMIQSISDPAIRGQAKVRRIYRLMTTNPVKAQELAKDDDIPARDRKRLEILLGRSGRGY